MESLRVVAVVVVVVVTVVHSRRSSRTPSLTYYEVNKKVYQKNVFHHKSPMNLFLAKISCFFFLASC